MSVTLADIAAMERVLDDVIEASDSMTTEEAAAFKGACQSLASKAKKAADLCNMQGVKTLEDGGPVTIGDHTYSVERKYTKVVDHVKIRQRIIRWALYNPETGSKRRTTIEQAVTDTVDVLYALFVAPKDEPKSAGLKMLKLPKDAVVDEVETGKNLVEGIR